MASQTTRNNPNTAARGTAQTAGGIACSIGALVAARARELVTRGMDYDEASALAECEIFGGLQRSLDEVTHGRRD